MKRRVGRWLANRRLAWVHDVATIEADNIQFVHLRGQSALVPLPNAQGAVLFWTFDHRPGANPILFIRLTERESQAVYDADPFSVGMLEPARRSLRNRWGVMIVKCGHKKYSRPYRIPARISEAAFIERLDAAAATCPAYSLSFTGSKRESKSAQQLDALRVVGRVHRQLAHA